ncbi:MULTISPECIES: hypothetical protein [unclassified Methylobacterium]|uniref:hypothetical protein n=1 Tax=unclassified Methylobacterium TaxID=2615210 RepID=UPI00164F350B|nr:MULTISPECIES: hypothetical protein [unclassified Methylobacterium]
MNVSFDGAAFSRRSRAYIKETVTPALGEAVLYMAASARKQLSEATEVFFDRPIDWTVDGFALKRVEGSKAAEALVYVLPGRAEYLGLEISGAERVAGDFATTDQGPLVPGRDAVLDEHSNLHEGFVSDAVSRGARWIEAKPGRPSSCCPDATACRSFPRRGPWRGRASCGSRGPGRCIRGASRRQRRQRRPSHRL